MLEAWVVDQRNCESFPLKQSHSELIATLRSRSNPKGKETNYPNTTAAPEFEKTGSTREMDRVRVREVKTCFGRKLFQRFTYVFDN